MKKYLLAILIMVLTLPGVGCKKDKADTEDFANSPRTELPDALMAPGSGYWTWGTISSINFHDTESTEYRNAGGVSVFFQFFKDGRFKFLMYINASDRYTRNQTWTEAEGTVVAGTTEIDGQTYQTIKLYPVKGTDRVITNSKNTLTKLNKAQLAAKPKLNTTYVFARYPQDGRQFLDMLDLTANFLTSFHEEYFNNKK